MRRKYVLLVAPCVLLALPISFIPANAETSPSPLPTPTATPGSPLTPMEKYRIDRENYFNAMRAITLAFKNSCDRANAAFALAIASAKNKDEKRIARNAREAAISEASTIFERAKSELGPMPVEPPRAAKTSLKSRTKNR